MSNGKKAKFIEGAGGCIVSKNILNHNGNLKWLFREESVNEVDNGWRFLSDIDTDEFINNPNNMTVCDFNTVVEIEPAVLAIYHLPVGTDLQLVVENNKRFFVDNLTGKVIDI